MIKRDEIAGPSCLTHAADDAPLFVLRANDVLAPMAVQHWANEYFVKHSLANTFTTERRNKWEEALSIARAMAKWRENKQENGS